MDETIICRCSDVTLGRVRELISQGYTSMDEITRLGMGPCQGKTCSLLVMREIAAMTGVGIDGQASQTVRPPASGIRLELIAREAEGHA